MRANQNHGTQTLDMSPHNFWTMSGTCVNHIILIGMDTFIIDEIVKIYTKLSNENANMIYSFSLNFLATRWKIRQYCVILLLGVEMQSIN